MAACTYVVQHAQLHPSPFQIWLVPVYIANRYNINQVVKILDHILSLLTWWLDPTLGLERVPFAAVSPSINLVSDASALGWGAKLGNLCMQGCWSSCNCSLRINFRVLRVVRLARQAFLPHIKGRVVQVLTNNTTAVFYINRQGGARSSALCQEALRFWNFCV